MVAYEKKHKNIFRLKQSVKASRYVILTDNRHLNYTTFKLKFYVYLYGYFNSFLEGLILQYITSCSRISFYCSFPMHMFFNINTHFLRFGIHGQPDYIRQSIKVIFGGYNV